MRAIKVMIDHMKGLFVVVVLVLAPLVYTACVMAVLTTPIWVPIYMHKTK